MTAACVPFETVENRADDSLALTIWAKRASSNALAAVVGNALFAALAFSLNRLERVLTTEALEQFSEDQLRELSTKLKELMPRLARLCSEIESNHIAKKLLLRDLVKNVCESTENLDSALENINFALRPEFNAAISSAITRLRLGAEARDTVSR
jgi:hypothetical protein